MDVSKFKKFFTHNFFELILFVFFIFYYSLWIKYNFATADINNSDLNTAIGLRNFKPYISFYLNSILYSDYIRIFLGYCFFPALASIIIFKIFKKILSSNIWSFSLTLLSLSSTENFPFINYLVGLIKNFDLRSNVNLYENFEIMGFPIPSFSIFFFCLIFYLSLNAIRINKNKIFIITILWLLMMHIHPLDGLIGNIYWVSYLLILYTQNKIQLSKQNIFFLFSIYLANFIFLFYQLDFAFLKINIAQTISIYHIFFYFILPLTLMIICILILKVDFFEFYQRFANIYLLMFIEIILITASINGIGFELRMLETRITSFLLHFLYYIPILYFLSKDEIFYINSINKSSYRGKITILFYYIFNKYKHIYLLTFILLMCMYLIFSLNI